MHYRALGRSGLRISALSFGAWVTFGEQLDVAAAHRCMKAAFEAGVNFFDNAEVYAGGAAETIMGDVLQKAGWKRSDLVISTKIFWGGKGPNDVGLSRKHIVEGVDAALRRLRLDYVDLVFCHRPDFHTPLVETVRAMSHVVDRGRALYWGTSEWTAEQIRAAYEIACRERLIPPTMEQPQYNMFTRERVEKEYLRLYDQIGLGTTVWSPLASGLLTGKYVDGIPAGSRLGLENWAWLRERMQGRGDWERRLGQVKQLRSLAAEIGVTLPQLALAWCLKNPHVSTVITGASRPEQVVENMKAIDAVEKLSREILDRIEEVLENRPTPEEDFRKLFD
ncbi:MAG: aldo/keto reductase [Planctomycetes bacterium]|nr:aldo/keto reductase [Planctomycetota bacterium]